MMRDLKILLFVIVTFLLVTNGLAVTRDVPATYATIQLGLNGASAGDTVLVQPGTYIENITWTTVQGITLLSSGGAGVTIIDGNASGIVITFPTGQNYTNTTVIDGFTIQNGYNTGTGWRLGAGIYARDCSAIFRNLKVKNNVIGGTSSSALGAGVYAYNSPNLVIDNCSFIDNELRASSFLFGGVIYCESNTDATISNSRFLNNKVIRIGSSGPRCYGGVIYAEEGCDLTITNVVIDSTEIEVNSYIYGGAIYLERNESTLTNVEVGNTSTASNSGRVYGGGVYYADGDSVSAAATWNNVTISGQDILATSYIIGGALYLSNTTITINNSFFTKSVCNNSGGRVYGGGVYVDGGEYDLNRVYMTCNQTLVATSSYNYGAGFYINDATVTLTNALIANNEASNANTSVSRTAGLGIYVGSTGVLTATNVTVTENTRVETIASYGTGIANMGGTINLVNSIFWNNDTGNEVDGYGTNNITYSLIRGGHAGTGNINSNPLFVTPGSDYHLQAGSPAVDVGTATGAPTEDLDGSSRPAGAGHDMGAFDRQPYTNTDFCPTVLVLPIDLLSFNAVCNEGSVLISWATLSEINNDYFILEKSDDAVHFTEYGRKEGAGNSNTVIRYNTTDDDLNKEVVYYRLKQVDFNGVYSYSNIIALRCNQDQKLVLYPNPVSDYIYINTLSPINSISLINNIGQKVTLQKKYKGNDIAIDVSSFAKGIYFIQIEFGDKNKVITKKVVLN